LNVPSASSTRGSAPGHGAAGFSAHYYDTAAALGFLVEAVEPPSRMPPTDFTLSQ
jgi:hypothetical protein